MTRQQRRYREREINKCARGMAYITKKKHPNLVDHNEFEFLKAKANRLIGRGGTDGEDTSETS